MRSPFVALLCLLALMSPAAGEEKAGARPLTRAQAVAKVLEAFDSKDQAALKGAQEHVRSHEKWRHPYYWAAWVLWGLPD